MSPQETFRCVKAPLSIPQNNAPLRSGLSNSAQESLEIIAAEIAAMPTLTYPCQTKTEKRRHPSDGLIWFILTDVLSLFGGFAVAWSVTSLISSYVLGRSFESLSLLAEGLRFAQFALVSLGTVLWFCHMGHYKTRMPFWFETQQIVKALCFALIVDGFFQFASKQDPSRLWLTSGWLFAGASLLLMRFLVRTSMRRAGTWQLRTLLVGSGAIADETRAALRSEPELGYNIIMQIENLPLLLEQAHNSWEKLRSRFNADYVVIAMDGHALANSGEAVAQLAREGVPFSVSPPLRHLPVLGMTPQYFFNHDVMLMTHTSNLEQPLARFLKRSMDLFLSSLGLLLFSPFLFIFAVLIKRDGGPVFFSDLRMGLDGCAFKCFKFRSMVENGEEVLNLYLQQNPAKRAEWNRYHKLLNNDPRITPIGSFLRRWSLDELPQLINVLRGDMSLVGPRPVNEDERQNYDKDISQYDKVRPGLTGLWQVSGRSNISFAQRVQMDSWYVRNWSLWHDIAILFKTIPAVFKKTGAC